MPFEKRERKQVIREAIRPLVRKVESGFYEQCPQDWHDVDRGADLMLTHVEKNINDYDFLKMLGFAGKE